MAFVPGAYRKQNDPVYLGSGRQYEEPKEVFRLVVDLIRSDFDRPLSLIDVGCASGAFLYYAKTRLDLSECVGMDISDAHLEQARTYVSDVVFVLDSITLPRQVTGRQFDVCTCLGTIAIFDEIDEVLVNLMNLVKQGGGLYVLDLVNDDPVDVLMRYRLAGEDVSEWQSGFNVRSRETYEQILLKIDPNVRVSWTAFKMPFAIPKTEDPMRAWTMQTEHNAHQVVVGTGQLLNIKVLRVLK